MVPLSQSMDETDNMKRANISDTLTVQNLTDHHIYKQTQQMLIGRSDNNFLEYCKKKMEYLCAGLGTHWLHPPMLLLLGPTFALKDLNTYTIVIMMMSTSQKYYVRSSNILLRMCLKGIEIIIVPWSNKNTLKSFVDAQKNEQIYN